MGGRPRLRTARLRRIEPEGPSGLPAAGTGNRTARAEFFLCLAGAFSPPVDGAICDWITRRLADDLDALAARTAYPVAAEIAALRGAVAAVPDSLGLLQLYSGLFLSPPAKVDINAGLYLDGGILGPSELEMERRYARHGLKRADGFRDLSDHLSPMLEFLAFLWAKAEQGQSPVDEAIAWCRDFLDPWLPRFVGKIADACVAGGLPGVYLHLARIVGKSIAHDIVLAEGTGGGSGD
jgi:TorA maturation chaperone TorD